MRATSLLKAVFAHRGASAHAPENTLAAFRLAQQSQADGIEFDIHLTKDQQIVVIHDEDVARTTNGHGKIQDLSLEEIRRLDAGQGETVPALTEVLDMIGDQMYINIELKGFGSSAAGLPEKTIALVKAHRLGDKVIYSSFNPLLLIRIRRHTPEAKMGLLMLAGRPGTAVRLIFSPWVRPWSLHPDYSSVTQSFLERANHKGLGVITWTVNHPDEMRRLFLLGIQGIITDDPVHAIEVRSTT